MQLPPRDGSLVSSPLVPSFPVVLEASSHLLPQLLSAATASADVQWFVLVQVPFCVLLSVCLGEERVWQHLFCPQELSLSLGGTDLTFPWEGAGLLMCLGITFLGVGRVRS